MRRRDVIRFGAAGLALASTAGLARAADTGRWLRAASSRFVVYASSPQAEVRATIDRLEVFHRLLSLLLLDGEERTGRPLSVYFLDRLQDQSMALGEPTRFVAGFYNSSVEETAAIAFSDPRDLRSGLGGSTVLFHEYVHHFMRQNISGAFPRWFTEGVAEYFSTVDIKARSIEIGGYNKNRAAWLVQDDPIPVTDLLDPEFRLSTGPIGARYYATAWLLTHWIFAAEDRQAAWGNYLRGYRNGEDPIASFQTHFGVPARGLERTLMVYSGRFPVRQLNFSEAQDWSAEARITPMPPSADDLLAARLRLRLGVEREEDADLLAFVRRQAQKHPDDAFAALTLAHAEILLGEPEAAIPLAAPFKDLPDTFVEATHLTALALFQQAKAAPERIGAARAAWGRVYQRDPTHLPTLVGLASTYLAQGAATHPNLIAALESAYALAPQVQGSTFMLVYALLRLKRYEEAIWVLEPLTTNPHNPNASEAARELLAQAQAGLSGGTPAAAPAEDGAEAPAP